MFAVLKKSTVEHAITDAKELGKKAVGSIRTAVIVAGISLVLACVALAVAILK